MKRHPQKLQALLRLARHAAHRRAPAPGGEPDAAEIRRLAQHALRARERAGAPRGDRESRPASWAVAIVRLCWWGAGAAVVLRLVLGGLHRPPPEPEVFEVLLNWPAAEAGSTPDLF